MVQSLRRCEKSETIDRLLRFVAAGIGAWILSCSFAPAQVVRPRYLLTSSQILGVMEDRQLPTRGVQVRLAVPITARIANPPLEIQAVAILNPHEVRLRVACRDHSQCLSFFAIATYAEDVNPGSFPVKLDHAAADTEHALGVAKPAAEAALTLAVAKPGRSGEAPIMRSGSPATVDFEGDRVHIRVEVICLESGAAGDKIRVTSRDHKQVYVAEIVAPTLLKGTLTK